MRARDRAKVIAKPPARWWTLFGPVPGRSSKVRCLLCGASGYGSRHAPWTGFDGRQIGARPAPWQADHIAGHPVRCATCQRPFINGTALSSHQRCRLHHSCCRHHTTVPPWKNPFTREATA